MAVQLERLAGRPQDIEWAIDDAGAVRLLQSRPITTLHGPVSGPLYGPGPLAETFPDALSPLEEDLWLDPLRDGLRHALGLLGGSSPGRLRRAPLVISVDGRPAVDLVLLGADPRRRSLLSKLDPRPGRPPAARRVAGRPAHRRAARPRPRSHRRHRRRPAGRAGARCARRRRPPADPAQRRHRRCAPSTATRCSPARCCTADPSVGAAGAALDVAGCRRPRRECRATRSSPGRRSCWP